MTTRARRPAAGGRRTSGLRSASPLLCLLLASVQALPATDAAGTAGAAGISVAVHGVPAALTDPDWTRGVAEARSIYERFLVHGEAVPPSLVALSYPTTRRNRVDVRVGVRSSWAAIRGAIRGAGQSIDITMIGWQVDELVPFHKAETFGFELIDTLCEAARRGVSVNVAVNDMWFKQKGWYLTGGFDRHFDNAIKSGRCQDERGKKLRYVRGIAWHRGTDFVVGRYDHRKVWIIDGATAFVGGYTVSDEMRDNMFDMEWELRGPVVAQLQANFLMGMAYAKAPLADFKQCSSALGGGGCPGVDAEQCRTVLDAYFPPPPPDDPAYSRDVTIVQNNPLFRDPEALGVTRLYHHLIGTALERLQISSPFFTSDEIVSKILDRYRERGCQLNVDVLFPLRPEHMLIWGNKGRREMERLVTGARDIRRQ